MFGCQIWTAVNQKFWKKVIKQPSTISTNQNLEPSHKCFHVTAPCHATYPNKRLVYYHNAHTCRCLVWHTVKSPSKSKKMKTTTYAALETVQKEFCSHTLSAESSRFHADWVGGGNTGIQTDFPPPQEFENDDVIIASTTTIDTTQ